METAKAELNRLLDDLLVADSHEALAKATRVRDLILAEAAREQGRREAEAEGAGHAQAYEHSGSGAH